LRFRLRNVGRIDEPISCRVADQNAHVNGDITESGAVVHAEKIDRERLRVADVGQANRDDAPVHSKPGNASSFPTLWSRSDVRHRHWCGEGYYDGVIATRSAGSVFNSGWTRDWKIDIDGQAR